MNQQNGSALKDAVIIGAALFAMFFGAGSLIFPPYLGMMSGPEWVVGFLSFFISDIGIAFLGIFAMIWKNGDISQVTGRVGNIPSLAINTAMVLCIGPLFAVPRTGATAFEMAIVPLMPDFSLFAFSLIYFTIMFVLTIRFSKVVDIVGKALTPLLLILLSALIVVGIVNPIGPFSAEPMSQAVVADGIIAGYQSLDVFASLVFAMVIIKAVSEKGYGEGNPNRYKVLSIGSLICVLCLAFVYGGISYLGATASTLYTSEINQAQLIVEIASLLFTKSGAIVLGFVVALACMTTGIGVTSASAAYFASVSNNKIKYEYSVTIISIFSLVVCNMGLSAIISLAIPVLLFLYPLVLVLIFTSIGGRYIKNDNSIKMAVFGAGIVSLFTTLDGYGYQSLPLDWMPLYAEGMNWILPAIFCGIIGSFIKPKVQN